MEEKLRSISKRIHWSLALRAAVFAGAWLVLPYWLFFLIALWLYAVPAFQGGQTRRLAVPFFVLLAVSFFEAQGALAAVIFGAIFYLILLIRALIVIDRRSAYEFLVLMLSFLLLREFYTAWNGGPFTGAVMWWVIPAAGTLALLLRSYLRYFDEDIAVPDAGARAVARASVWLSFLLFWQVMIAALFLPLDFVYQTVVAFLASTLIIELVPAHLMGGVAREKLLTAATAVFALLVITLASARWGM